MTATMEITTCPCAVCGLPTRWYPDDGNPPEPRPCTVCYDAKYGADTTEKWGTENEKRRKRESAA